MVNVFSWILSPEIREYLREHYRPNLMEKQALIRSAYRPVEEKLAALQELLHEAETEEDQLFLESNSGLPACDPGNPGVPPGRILSLPDRPAIRRRQRTFRISL